MATQLRIGMVVVVCGALAACGGDSKADGGVDTGLMIDSGHDSGTTDGGTDGGGMDSGPTDMGPTDSGTGLMPCDPTLTTSTCPTGMYCAITLHAPAVDGGMNTIGYGECVPNRLTMLSEGSTCGGFQALAGTPGVSADPCGNGLFCWNEPTSTVRRCHRVCDDMMAGCHTGEYCLGLNDTPFFGTCTPANNCDVFGQTGCHASQGCYVVTGTTGDLYSSCFDFTPPDGGTGAPGDPCMFLGECQPGSQCLADMLPDGGATMTRDCKPLCDTMPVVGDPDAGIDGGPMPICTTGSCMPFMLGAPDASVMIAEPVGFCQ